MNFKILSSEEISFNFDKSCYASYYRQFPSYQKELVVLRKYLYMILFRK